MGVEPVRRQAAVYRQIVDDIRGQITAGVYAAGDQLPSENTLGAEYGTTRATVVKAIVVLRGAGWIESRQGVGHFVLPAAHRATVQRATKAAFWWTVPAVVVRAHDGDTVLAALDLGWHLLLSASIRVAHINAPELPTPQGEAAAVFAQQLLPPGADIMVTSERLDKYGRTLATITMHEMWHAPDGRSTADFGTAMLWSGNAVPYEGG